MKDLSALLAQMTIEEKVGQLMLLSANFFGTDTELTGPAQEWGLSPEELSRVGGCLGGKDASTVRKIQEKHLASDRNKIPLMFMNDVIHGLRRGRQRMRWLDGMNLSKLQEIVEDREAWHAAVGHD